MTRIALYIRVSTKKQDYEMQKRALLDKAQREGWTYELFEEKESTRRTRPVKYALYQRLLNKAFDGVCVWKIDRWARSTTELSREITALYKNGVKFISLTDNIDLSSASGVFQFNIIAAFCQFERDIISERTKEAFYVDEQGVKRSVSSNKAVGKRGKDNRPRKKGGYYLRYHPQTKGIGSLGDISTLFTVS